MKSYFNALGFRRKLADLSRGRLMHRGEFDRALSCLRDKNIVILGCGAQGLHQGLNMRDSGLNVAYVLKKRSIDERNSSWRRANDHGFKIGTCRELLPTSDFVINLTPDKQHSRVLEKAQRFMKKHAVLGYSHGFNIVEVGEEIRSDITVVMVAPKCPGTEVRKEYRRGLGVPALVAVHERNDARGVGLSYAKAWAKAIGSHRVGVLHTSFVAEVKSDLMGEQTILCGLLQVGSVLCYEKMIADRRGAERAGRMIQFGWRAIARPLHCGGIALMMNRLSSAAKVRVFRLSEQLKHIMKPLFEAHMDDILDGSFSERLLRDWSNRDRRLDSWRQRIRRYPFGESMPSAASSSSTDEQMYFDHGTLMVAFLKSGIELSFEVMRQSGLSPYSGYYESLHEVPLIANLIARGRLDEMNRVISDTAEYGSFLFTFAAYPLLQDFVLRRSRRTDLADSIPQSSVDNAELHAVDRAVRRHAVERVGDELRNVSGAVR